MSKFKTRAAILSTSLLVGAGCGASSHEAVPSNGPTTIAGNSQKSGPSTVTNQADTRAASLIKTAENEFVTDAEGKGAQITIAAGLCAIIAYREAGSIQTSVDIAADPGLLVAIDPVNSNRVNVSVAYNELTDSFVFGEVEIADPSNHKVTPLTGSTQEFDAVSSQGIEPHTATVEVSGTQKGTVDVATGVPTMNVNSQGVLSGSLANYANSDTASLVCNAGFEASAGQLTSMA